MIKRNKLVLEGGPIAKDKREKMTPLTIAMLVVLIIFAISLLGILVWAFIISFKDERWITYYNDSYFFPQFLRNNFGLAFEGLNVTIDGVNQNLARLFLNSFIYALGCAFFNTLVPCLTAYWCARYKFKWSRIMYAVVVVCMIIPVVGSLPSEIRTSKGFLFGLVDIFGGNNDLRNMLAPYGNFWGLWLMRANFLGLYFLVFFEFFSSIPDSYMEAAKIDGATPFKIMYKIGLPLVRNLFLTVLLINFITYWNDYQTPMVFMARYPVISQGVLSIMWGNPSGGPVMIELCRGIGGCCAAVVLMIIPTLILFLAFNKKLMGNLSVGGIKG